MKAYSVRRMGILLASLALASAACSDSSSTPADTNTGGSSGANGSAGASGTAGIAGTAGSAGHAGNSGTSSGGTDLVPEDTTSIVVTDQGGFGGSRPPGSECAMQDRTYTLDPATRALSWKVCTPDGDSFSFTTGSRILTAAELADLVAALHALHHPATTMCGYDKPTEAVVFTTPSGDTKYLDDFYFCDAAKGDQYVTGLDEVIDQLVGLAKETP